MSVVRCARLLRVLGSLLQYKESNGTIEEIANDYSPHWMTGVDMIDDDTFIGAENCYHLFTVSHTALASCADPRLPLVWLTHLGLRRGF
jgi:DNA damage-binding protein 1